MSETPDGETVLDSEIPTNGSTHPGEDPYARAEESFDRIGAQVGAYVAAAGKWLNRMTMRAREEAEDIVVEAQDMHRRWNERR